MEVRIVCVGSRSIRLLRKNLKEAFEGVVDAIVDLKFATSDAKVSFKDKLTAIVVNINRDFKA